jgi:hypothetical protein
MSNQQLKYYLLLEERLSCLKDLFGFTDILRKYPEQVKYVNTVACERLIKSLYYNHITDI